MRVSQEVALVLGSMVAIEPGPVVKITGQLDRPLYVAVNKALEGVGGKWNRKVGGHTFTDDPGDALDQLITTGEYECVRTRDQQLGFFETPDAVIARMFATLDLAHIPKDATALEPSAGGGRLVNAMKARGWCVFVHEIDPGRAAKLGCAPGDFLLHPAPETPRADVVMMNPPFANGADIAHVVHALQFLKPGGQLVSVMSSGVTFRTDKRTVAFRQWLAGLGGVLIELPANSFRSSGTGVNTVLVRIDR